jgi:hypothetical protein
VAFAGLRAADTKNHAQDCKGVAHRFGTMMSGVGGSSGTEIGGDR